MLVNLYKSKTPLSVFTLPLIVGLLTLSLFVVPARENVYYFAWQTRFFGSIQEITWLNFVLSWALVSLNANQLNHVFNRNAFYSKDTFLPGFIYVIGLVTFKSLDFSPLLLAHLFLIGAMAELLQLKRQEASKDVIFRCSFLIGLAAIFSPLVAVLFLLPWIALLLVKPFIWREWMMAILGAIIPVGYHYAIYFVATGTLAIERMPVSINNPQVTWTILEGAVYLVTACCLLVGFFKFLLIMRVQIVHFKKMSQIILWMALLLTFSFVTGWYFFGHLYLSFLLPVAFMVSIQLLNAGRVQLANGLVILWFIISAVNLFA